MKHAHCVLISLVVGLLTTARFTLEHIAEALTLAAALAGLVTFGYLDTLTAFSLIAILVAAFTLEFAFFVLFFGDYAPVRAFFCENPASKKSPEHV